MKTMASKQYTSRVLLFCLLIVAACSISVHGQSGRRQPKAPPAAPVPTPTPEPTPAPKKEKDPSELAFILASDNSSAFEVYPLSYYDAAMRGCADRLRSGSSASVTVSEGNMNRGEAIKKAKGETTNTYVVLIKLVLDEMYARSYDDLEVDFTVFAPKTGKVVVFGRSYQNINRKGPIVVGPTSRGSSGALYREQLLKFAGEDAANRILKAMSLDVVIPKSSAN
jgi:hypothetical protein